MNADLIQDFLRRQPFEPFVIRLSNGETHEVRHPECAIVMRTQVLIYYPDAKRAASAFSAPSPFSALREVSWPDRCDRGHDDTIRPTVRGGVGDDHNQAAATFLGVCCELPPHGQQIRGALVDAARP